MGARKTWADRALENAALNEESLTHAGQAIALACAPVKPAPRFDPIDVTDAPTVAVTTEWVEVKVPKMPSADESTAAVRDYLGAANAWGPSRQVAVLVETSDGIQRLVLDGQAGAIAHAVPDRETLKTWAAAGADAFPMVLNPGEGPMRSVAWLPLDELPKVLQVEYASRASFAHLPEPAPIDEDVTHGSHDDQAEPSAKDVARALITMFDPRSEAAALAYKGVGLG